MKKKPIAPPIIAPIASPEPATQAHAGTPQYGDYGHPSAAPLPPAPNRRAEGGNVYDLTTEQTAL